MMKLPDSGIRDLKSSEEKFEIRCRDAGLGVCLAGYWFCFGPPFPYFPCISPLWNDNVFSMLMCVGNM